MRGSGFTMDDGHFNTAPGWPASRAEVEAASDKVLDEFMGCCDVEPADFDECLACYAYQVAMEREASRSMRPSDPDLHAAAVRIVTKITSERATTKRDTLVDAVEQELVALVEQNNQTI